MALTIDQWHRRFIQQARWTRDLRKYLYQWFDKSNTQSILEVGCGTGALLGELLNLDITNLHGLDINLDFLEFAHQHTPEASLACGDAHSLPYPTNSFDIVSCHYFFLWINSPTRVLAEMVRVTHHGGLIMALAEPDYGGRIDFPNELSLLGEWQEASLRNQGADTYMGRQLRRLMFQAKLENIETGVLGAQWRSQDSLTERESEWKMLESDLKGLIPREKLSAYLQMEESAWIRGERVLFIPTFYALGMVSK